MDKDKKIAGLDEAKLQIELGICKFQVAKLKKIIEEIKAEYVETGEIALYENERKKITNRP